THGAHEVPTARAIHPRGAHHPRARPCVQHSTFTRQLAVAIDRSRTGFVLRFVRPVGIAGEHVVRGHVHQRQATHPTTSGEGASSLRVHAPRAFRFSFGGVDGGVCGRVEYDRIQPRVPRRFGEGV